MADTPEWANQLIQKMDALTTTVTAEVARLDGAVAGEVARLDWRLDHINSRFETGDASFQTLLSEFNVLKSGSAASPSVPGYLVGMDARRQVRPPGGWRPRRRGPL